MTKEEILKLLDDLHRLIVLNNTMIKNLDQRIKKIEEREEQ